MDGSLTSNGNNLIGNTSGTTLIGSATSDIADADAMLGSLADKGGPTLTIALLAGSPTLDSGVAAGLTTDQPGTDRAQGPAIDIGVFESALAWPADSSPLSITATSADQNEGDTGSTDFTFTVTRNDNTVDFTTVDFTVSGTGDNPAGTSALSGVCCHQERSVLPTVSQQKRSRSMLPATAISNQTSLS